MEIDDLISIFPRLFHMAEVGSWPSIQRHGLLSTTALLDLFELAGPERDAIESQRRPESVTIRHSRFGTAVIRDQKPLRNVALEGCLRGMTVPDWYRTLNSKVFFWLTEERLETFLTARAYRSSDHIVITIDTARLIEQHLDRLRLSAINTGATLYAPPIRGVGTFLRVGEYPFKEQKKRRGLANAVVEVAVERAVSPIEDVLISVAVWRGARLVRTL